ncbi:MAG: prepilin-type N-terminal cleavage/methylation domain-containing protein [Methylobacter sp.]|uniref:prepilin-type N-terminal cleavage/methylation domain-containing protein n=1 Tax=Methylobacter sp. TaxID=2051955 RepID=UPI0025863FCE|nr:prepilin-type N-terminal cleavage/methylation domain-containing protein [Methylobacter sp.]MCL7419900.1 prepilin-type N-terminal cleavage/methylation domain-containing protein [Methylobacter sp.]
MNTSSLTQTRGFTLLEMTVVLLLMTLLASVAIRETNGLSFQVRYEQTRERLERIREAILGNPRQIINGQQAVSGFVADMGRLPDNLHELLEQNFCSDRTYSTQATCEAAGKTWNVQTDWQPHSTSGLWYGWRGPYLNISGSALDDDAFTDGWGRLDSDKTDQNYGWRVEDGLELNTLSPHPTNDKRMVIQSYGKNHEAGGADYDADYPSNRYSIDDTTPYTHPAPLIDQEDWLVDISGGIEVSLLKPNSAAIPIISFCTDPSKTTKAACETENLDTSLPYGSWIGGCNESGFINKDSCTSSSKKWFSCNINTLDDSDAGFAACSPPNCYKTKSTCEQANGVWFGQGYGCSDQAKSSKLNCTGINVWRSCSDNGTITTQSACDAANENWYGDNIVLNDINSVGIRRFRKRDICLNLFYRKSDTSEVTFIPSKEFQIDENGAYQTIRFNFTNPPPIPIGKNAIGIYEYDGDCDLDNPLYPADRQNPIQVDFHPRTGLPVINW